MCVAPTFLCVCVCLRIHEHVCASMLVSDLKGLRENLRLQLSSG